MNMLKDNGGLYEKGPDCGLMSSPMASSLTDRIPLQDVGWAAAPAPQG